MRLKPPAAPPRAEGAVGVITGATRGLNWRDGTSKRGEGWEISAILGERLIGCSTRGMATSSNRLAVSGITDGTRGGATSFPPVNPDNPVMGREEPVIGLKPGLEGMVGTMSRVTEGAEVTAGKRGSSPRVDGTIVRPRLVSRDRSVSADGREGGVVGRVVLPLPLEPRLLPGNMGDAGSMSRTATRGANSGTVSVGRVSGTRTGVRAGPFCSGTAMVSGRIVRDSRFTGTGDRSTVTGEEAAGEPWSPPAEERPTFTKGRCGVVLVKVGTPADASFSWNPERGERAAPPRGVRKACVLSRGVAMPGTLAWAASEARDAATGRPMPETGNSRAAVDAPAGLAGIS